MTASPAVDPVPGADGGARVHPDDPELKLYTSFTGFLSGVRGEPRTGGLVLTIDVPVEWKAEAFRLWDCSGVRMVMDCFVAPRRTEWEDGRPGWEQDDG